MSFPHHPGVGPLPPLQSQGCELAVSATTTTDTLHQSTPSIHSCHSWSCPLRSLKSSTLFISSVDSCAPWGLHVPSLGMPTAGCSLQLCPQVWVSLLAPLDLSIHWTQQIHYRQLEAVSHQGRVPQTEKESGHQPQAWKDVVDLGVWE